MVRVRVRVRIRVRARVRARARVRVRVTSSPMSSSPSFLDAPPFLAAAFRLRTKSAT